MTVDSSDDDRLDKQALRDRQSKSLSEMVQQIAETNPFWKQRFAANAIDASQIVSPDALSDFPLLTKADLIADQTSNPPYGTNLTFDLTSYSRLHQTSGTTTGVPMRWLDTPDSWGWFMRCWEQIYRIVQLRPDDRLCFPFSFGPFIGFWAAFDGANRLGNLCLAGGGMSSEARLKLIEDNQATFVCCTPTYALRLAEVAASQGMDLASGSVRGLVVAGEPGGSIPATRTRMEKAWGARVFDHWGMTEIGSLAVECVENPGSLHMLETECIVEILDPNSDSPVQPGDQGELVVTNLGRVGSPLIRYRTGDLVQADTEPCACGRSMTLLKGGILGRVDDMVTIRGNNVFPSSLEAILRQFEEIAEFRIEVKTIRAMQHMRIEIEPIRQLVELDESSAQAVETLVRTVSQTIKERLNFQAEVVVVAPDSLPRFELKGRRFFRVQG